MSRLLLFLFLCLPGFSLHAQNIITTCRTCQGFGTVSVRERVPVRKDVTYRYVGSLTKVSTYVHYDTRHVQRTCYACNGSGETVIKPRPPRPEVVKRPPAPPSFKQNLQRKYGKEVTDPRDLDLAGPDYYSISYKVKNKRRIAVIKKVSSNNFQVIVPGEYSLIVETADENGNFFAFKAFAGNKVYFFDKNGQMFYQVKGDAVPINRAGDMWLLDQDAPEVEGIASRRFKMINYKSGRQLTPTPTYGVVDCQCQELWSRHKLIDVSLPHVFENRSIAKGITNLKGELIIPPIYTGVLSCDPYDGFIRMYDEWGYVYQFDLKGQLLLTEEETEVANCGDDLRVLRTKTSVLAQLPTSKVPNPKIESSERYRLEAPSQPALQGATFGSFNCFDEKGWAEVTASFSGKSYRFHKNGVLTSPSAYYEKHGKQPRIASLPELKPEAVPRSTVYGNTSNIKLINEGGKQGAEVTYGYKDNGKPIVFNIKAEYARVIPIKKGMIQVQNDQGLWGAYIIEKWNKAKLFYVKPQYESLACVDGLAGTILLAGLKGGTYYGIGLDYTKKSLYTTPFEKMSSDRAERIKNHLAFNESMPGISGRISDFLSEEGLAPDSISEYESLRYLDKFKYGDRYMVWVLWKKYNYLHSLPPDTRAVGVPVELKGKSYLPIQGTDGRWKILYISTSRIRPLRNPSLTFDAVHDKQLADEDSPITVFENSCGYFKLELEKPGMRVDEGKGVPFLMLLEEK
jgi:hypothetical protein